ncbi:hypothetical protein SOVF_026370 [Spinacia oleracea]|nr:hypothetical protein SOVF_026370 [Spinacia oleracea]
MAIISPVKEVSLELFRELLIAISQSEPENRVSSKSFYEYCNSLNGAKVKNEDKTEELRSELISISCASSADNVIMPSMSMQEAES